MKIKLTPKNTVALVFLSFFMQETHELAHTSIGRLICGCWGERNFNVWSVCKGCSSEQPLSLLATVAGPFYSFSIIWIGYYLLTKPSSKLKSAGFSLIVASMPFSRVLTPVFGSGDEVLVLNRLLNNHTLAWVISLALVFLLAIPPVVKIWHTIQNKPKGLWITSLLLVPFLLTGLVVFAILQESLLNKGVLSDYWILGSPVLVTVWLILCVIVCIVLGRSLTTILQPTGTKVL